MDTEDSKDTASDSEELKSAPESMKGIDKTDRICVLPRLSQSGMQRKLLRPYPTKYRAGGHVYLSQAAKW